MSKMRMKERVAYGMAYDLSTRLRMRTPRMRRVTLRRRKRRKRRRVRIEDKPSATWKHVAHESIRERGRVRRRLR